MQQAINLSKRYISFAILGIIVLLFLFLRLYQIEQRNQFTWDQIDNAWAAKHIIMDHQFPLLGMQAKGKTGFYIGPLYYYYIVPFYLITNLDPIASGIIAAVTAFLGLAVIFFVTKNIFSLQTAIFAVIIQTLSDQAIVFDRVQWPVQFVPILGLLVFYVLYKIMEGNAKYILPLFILIGLGFHIHFTLIVFFPIITLLCLPFFPRKKVTLVYGLLGILSFIIFLIPSIIVEIATKNEHTKNMTSYLQTNFHGFHLRRFFQITQDALIQIEEVVVVSILKPLKFITIPLVFIFGYFRLPRKQWLILMYLTILWFLIPWIIFATYNSEISDYYFSFNRFLAVVLLSFVLSFVFSLKTIFPKICVFLAICYFAYVNYIAFSHIDLGDIARNKPAVLQEIKKAGYIPYSEGDIKSYLFYSYSWELYHRKAY